MAADNISPAAEPKKSGWKRVVLEWVGYFALLAVILFFFAPESWWQFGVSPEAERKTGDAFTLTTLDGGEPWDFEAMRGNVVVVNYWATWCPPCRIETPGLVSFAKEHRDKGVVVVGVTMDDDLSLVPPFVESYEIGYPILLPGDDPNLGNGDIALPTTFLYDKTGKLAKKYTGLVLEPTLRSDTAALLAE